MPTAGTTGRIAEAPTRHKDRIVGAYYLLTILAGVFVLYLHGRLALTADLIATIAYIAVTVLFHALSKERLTNEGRDLNRTVTEPVRTVSPRRSRRPYAPRVIAHDKTRVIRTSTKFQPRLLNPNRPQQNSVGLNKG
jgi:hypothetical protein